VTARVTVVVNPTSGRGRAARVLPEVQHRLAAIGAEVLVSDGPEHAASIARGAADGGAEIVVAMGGDGMVGMVGATIIGSPAALGLIPATTSPSRSGTTASAPPRPSTPWRTRHSSRSTPG